MFSALAKKRVWGPSARDVEREKITIAAFGKPKSWGTFNNRDVDLMKAHLQALLTPDSLTAQMATINAAEKGERRSLIWRCEQLMQRAGFAEAYTETLSVYAYDRRDWRDLPLDQLTNIRVTLQARAGSKAKRPVEAVRVPDPDNEPF